VGAEALGARHTKLACPTRIQHDARCRTTSFHLLQLTLPKPQQTAARLRIERGSRLVESNHSTSWRQQMKPVGETYAAVARAQPRTFVFGYNRRLDAGRQVLHCLVNARVNHSQLLLPLPRHLLRRHKPLCCSSCRVHITCIVCSPQEDHKQRERGMSTQMGRVQTMHGAPHTEEGVVGDINAIILCSGCV